MPDIFKAASGTSVHLHSPVIIQYYPDLLPLQCSHLIFLQREDFLWSPAISPLITSFLLSWDQFLLKALLLENERWKLWKIDSTYFQIPDTITLQDIRHLSCDPRLTIEMELLLDAGWLQRSMTCKQEHCCPPPARLDQEALLQWESNNTLQAPENSKTDR